MTFKHKKVIFQCFIFMLFIALIGCENKEQYSDEKYEAILYKYHSTNTNPKDIKEIDLVLSKNLDSTYTGLIYKLNERYFYGFLDANKNLISYSELKGNGSKSMFHKNHCFIQLDENKKPKAQDYCFTVFVGKVPFEDYSEIELEWNCAEKSVQKLENKQYFFFFRKSSHNEVCNVKLRKSDGQTRELAFSRYTNSFAVGK